MKIFVDVFTGNELFNESYPIKPVDDLYYEVEGKNITVSADIDESLIDGNKAPGGSEAAAKDAGAKGSAVTGIDVVIGQRLVETPFNKASYKNSLKSYSKHVKDHLEKNSPDRVQHFQSGISKLGEQIFSNFDKYRFYTGESIDPEGMVVLQYYREDGLTPVFILFKDGLRVGKV